MGRSKKFDYPAAIQSILIAHPEGLSLDELLGRSGFEVDRSTLFRHLKRLIQGGSVERLGKARASRYRPLGVASSRDDPAPFHTQRPAVEDARPAEHSQAALAEANSLSKPEGVSQPDRLPDLASALGAVIKKAVRTAVREWKRCDRVNLQIYLSLLAKPEHLDTLTAAVEKELAGLHEGNLAEFGLTQAEFSHFIPLASD